MSNIPSLQCLFCNHCNVTSAKYCNECASPLHLQPCNQCGAIDNRTSITCYKCGAEFSVPAAPELAPVPAAPKRARVPAASKRARASAAPKLAAVPASPELATVPASAIPESVPASPILEHQVAESIRNQGGFAIERAFPSKSSEQVVGMIRQGLHREATEAQGEAAGVDDRDPTHLNPDPAHSAAEPQPMDKAVAPESVQYPVLALPAVEPQPMDETVESERAMTATASRRVRRLAYLTLLLAATAASGYYYYERSAQRVAQGQSAGQPAPSMPDGAISVGATTATVATQVDATSAPKDTASQPTSGAEEVEKAPAPAAGVVAKPWTDPDPEPVPANRPLDDSASASRPAATTKAAAGASSVRRSSVIDAAGKSRKDSPIVKECTDAVAALGLCGPIKP